MDEFELKQIALPDESGHHRHQLPSIVWKNLCAEVSSPFWCFKQQRRRQKRILHQLNGHLETATLNGIMGPSGAGKTTLLKCLSGNWKRSRLGGEVFVARQSDSDTTGKLSSYFIEQHVHENVVGEMSVAGILWYAHRFKNGTSGHSRATVKAHIERVLDELLLPRSILSQSFSVCSGGEQKRLAIAQELMAVQQTPEFLFIDEPTTGLDSAAALEVIKCLQNLSQDYQTTVITSIHSPSNEIIAHFNKLYVLAKAGVCIYTGKPAEIDAFMKQQIGADLTLLEHQPPVEALIKLACNGFDDSNIIKLANYTTHIEQQQVSTILDKSSASFSSKGLARCTKSFSFEDLCTQMRRQLYLKFWPNSRFTILQAAFYAFNIAFLASMFSAEMVKPDGCAPLRFTNDTNVSTVQYRNESDSTCLERFAQNALLQENINYHVFCGAIMGFMITCSATLNFASMLKIFHNEHRNKWYSLSTFYYSFNLASILELTLYASTISLVSYFISHQHIAIDDGHFIWNRLGHFTAHFWLLLLYTGSLGQLIGVCITRSAVLAVITAIMAYMTMDIMNDLLFQTDEFEHPLLVEWSNLVAFKFVTKYMIYALYGIGRCTHPNLEYSLVMQKYHVDSNLLIYYIVRLLANIISLRLVTLFIMYYKFSNFQQKCFNRKHSTLMLPEWEEHVKLQNTQINLPKIILTQASFTASNGELVNTKIIIGWRHLTLYVPKPIFGYKNHNEKPILQKLNGDFRFGTLNALMGASGAGKTSLLKVLNGLDKERLSPETLFYLPKCTKIETCFIAQEVASHLMPGLTAKQSLIYATKLKNCNTTSRIDPEKVALALLDELGLVSTADTKVDRCSDGERKRLALALELTAVRMPNLICIDEPTSGLDSNSAEIVISCLHKLTRAHNLTIIAAIHQPNSEILSLLDQLYVLARGGVCIYSGPPSQIFAHLSKIPNVQYPLETLISYSCADEEDKIVQQLVADQTAAYQKYINEQSVSSNDICQVQTLQYRNYATFSLKSVFILSHRYFAYIRGHLWQEWLLFALILLGYGASLLILWKPSIAYASGCVSLDQNGILQNCSLNKSDELIKEEQQLDQSFKYNFFMHNIFLLLILLHSSLSLYRELNYFRNEHRNGWYSTAAFYAMKSTTEIVPLLPITFVYLYLCNIFEPIRPGIYWHFVYISALSVLACQGMAHTIVLLSNGNIAVITLIFGLVYDCFLLLSNFFINIRHLNAAYRTVALFSIPRYTFESTLLLEYGFDAHYQHCIVMIGVNILVFRLIAWGLLVAKS